MNRIILLSVIGLSACTFAVNDPEKFDRLADKVSKTYQKERHSLYECFVGTIAVPSDVTYQTPSRSTYEKRGVLKIVFEVIAKNKTLMTVQTIRGGDWTIEPNRYIAVADGCSKK